MFVDDLHFFLSKIGHSGEGDVYVVLDVFSTLMNNTIICREIK